MVSVSLENAFDIFLSWLVVYGSFKTFNVGVITWFEEKATPPTGFQKTLPIFLCLAICFAISVGVFFLRTKDGQSTKYDYIYCFTAFIITSLPGIAGVLKVYYDMWNPKDTK